MPAVGCGAVRQDPSSQRVQSVVPKRVSFEAKKQPTVDDASSKQERDSFVIGGVRVGGTLCPTCPSREVACAVSAVTVQVSALVLL